MRRGAAKPGNALSLALHLGLGYTLTGQPTTPMSLPDMQPCDGYRTHRTAVVTSKAEGDEGWVGTVVEYRASILIFRASPTAFADMWPSALFFDKGILTPPYVKTQQLCQDDNGY
ncbi:hypothetical protein B7463_g3651, partial [Scytalidium lignicola]